MISKADITVNPTALNQDRVIHIDRYEYGSKKPKEIRAFIKDMTLYIKEYPHKVFNLRSNFYGGWFCHILCYDGTVFKCSCLDPALDGYWELKFQSEDGLHVMIIEFVFPFFIGNNIYYKFAKVIEDLIPDPEDKKDTPKRSNVSSNYFIKHGPVYTIQYY